MDKNILELAKHFEIIGKEFKKSNVCSNNECSLRDIKIFEFLLTGKKTMSELADHMNLTKGSMTTAIDSLIEKKYVKREDDKNDRRKVYIILLKKGENIAKIIFEKHIDVAKKICNILNDSQRKQFFKILSKISKELS